MGFVLEPNEAHDWIAEDRRNKEVLFPYLGGEDVNQRPDCSASRWVIDFNAASLEAASQFRLPFERVERLVYPERQRVNRKAHRERWWQFGDKRPALREAITDLDEVLVITFVSKTVMPVRVPTGQVFSHALGVVTTDAYDDQAVLSSSAHQLWAITYGSTMRTDVRYTPSDVFETFPRPTGSELLINLGQVLDQDRREIMIRRGIGLTKLYNLINEPQVTDASDPDIARMREIHRGLDEAVVDAYGWSDIPLDHSFHTYRQMERWTVSPAARTEILNRLLEENHRRAAEEAKQTPKVKSKGRRGKNASDEQGTLL
jgi:hypothetical protein